ncbi:MAG TPA: diguanylate cyclase [Arenicellales bacterium]|nr:diguanylate cyclase [Arenicellales bacterium]
MVEWVKAQLLAGAQGQPPALVRQILISNLTAALAAVLTSIYQVYYLIFDIVRFLPVFSLNLLFMGSYVGAIILNRSGRFDGARNLALTTVAVQLFVVTWLISAGAGVHLFYFTLAGMTALMFGTRRDLAFLSWLVLSALLFVVVHFAFPQGASPLMVPPPHLKIMFAGSAVGAMAVAGIMAQLLRMEVDRAETALMRSNRELERISGIDSLTGLANRRTMDAYLEREWRRLRRTNQPVSVLLFDVDCFKEYNDHYGHLAGDECLQKVAGVLSDVSGRSSDLVARYGGEEFVIILPGTDEGSAMELADKARERVMALRIEHRYSGVAQVVTLSAGVACAEPYQAGNPQDILHRADEALYAAKDEGRNRVVGWEPRIETA